MVLGNYSAEASVIEKGKTVKGILTLFADEYVFGGVRTAVNWENVTCEQGTVKVKAFLFSSEKPYVVFREGDTCSLQFILEAGQKDSLLKKVAEFQDSIRAERLEKEERARREQEESRAQEEREQRIREESRRKAEAEYQQRQEEIHRRREEQACQEQAALERKKAEKKERIRRETETCRNGRAQMISADGISKKAAARFLDNPYRILGISCLAGNEEANSALDKLKKLSRLKAIEAYRSPFDLAGLERPARDLSVAQNAVASLKDKTNKLFWFADADACAAWQSGKYRIELSRDGEELGSYDLFLANYLYGVLCDPDFKVSETWKRILSFYCFICRQPGCELIRSRFTEKELQDENNAKLLADFKHVIFTPILLLCERDDLDAVLRLHKCIRACGEPLLSGLERDVLSRLVSWFTDKEASVFSYLREADSEDVISETAAAEIRSRGDAYCRAVEPMLELVLRDFRGDAVRYDMIKESYRHTTYQLMYELNKQADKSDAIFFANKCYSYCSADDKKRIQNTFGAVNIKSIDWSVPHTIWDIKGDEYYYGRGCTADYAQALYWYRKAADAGNMYSPNSIGICYQKGQGVPQNDVQAASWFEKAYEKGNPEGAFNLAECCYSGTGVRKDVDKALKMWAEAAKLGHPSAEQRRAEVFSKVQAERRKRRASNHICHDLGFQMTVGTNQVVEVTLNSPANVYLVNAQGYKDYLNGNEFSYKGGYAADSPYRIRIPSSNRWYVIVDSGEEPISGIESSVKVKSAS